MNNKAEGIGFWGIFFAVGFAILIFGGCVVDKSNNNNFDSCNSQCTIITCRELFPSFNIEGNWDLLKCKYYDGIKEPIRPEWNNITKICLDKCIGVK